MLLFKKTITIFKPTNNITLNKRPQITLSKGIFKDNPVVFIDFEYDWKIVKQIRVLADAVYIYAEKRWYIAKNKFNLNEIVKSLSDNIEINTDALFPKPVFPKEYLALLKQKRYSESTIKTYQKYFTDFQEYFSQEILDEISTQQINGYILELIETKNISASQQNQRINAIKFYYEKVLGRATEYYYIERPRQDKKLPDVLSKEEVHAMLKATKNTKHKTIITHLLFKGKTNYMDF